MPALSTRKPLLHYTIPYLLVAPTLILVLMFNVIPAIQTVNDSFYKPARGLNSADQPPDFVGFQNYLDLFDETHYMGSRFRKTLENTITFTLATVQIGVPLGLLMALLLNRKLPFMALWRFSVFYPSLLPLIGAASIWSYIFSDSIGLANAILHTLGHPGLNWLGNPDYVLWSVIIVNIWKQSGYFMIFFLAGIQGIPQDYYEAASLDGASTYRQFTAITLPLLRRTILFVLVISVTFSFQTVEQLQALGQGGPADSANLLLYLIFQNIAERRNWGYVNAMTIILVSMLLIFTTTNFVLFERQEDN